VLKSADVVSTLAFRTGKGLHNGNINVLVLYLKSTIMTIGLINTLLHHLKTTAVAIVTGLILRLGNATSTLVLFFLVNVMMTIANIYTLPCECNEDHSCILLHRYNDDYHR